MKTVATAVCIGVLLGYACAQATFKGHQIGETADEFFKIDGTNAPEDCQAKLKDPKLRKDAEKARGKYPFGSVSGMMAMHTVDRCNNLLSVLAGKDGEIAANSIGSGSAIFRQGKLVMLTLDVGWRIDGPPTVEYGQVYADLVLKLGPPTEQGQDVYQNGFGATFTLRKATWATPQLRVVASEAKDHFTILSVAAPSYLQELKQKEQARPSSLD